MIQCKSDRLDSSAVGSAVKIEEEEEEEEEELRTFIGTT
jgi:hypothetical protein